MKQISAILALGLALSAAAVNAQTPGKTVVSEQKLSDPFYTSGATADLFGASGMQSIGDIDGDGNNELIAGAPKSFRDSGSIVMLKLNAAGALKAAPMVVVSARNPLISPYLSRSSTRDQLGGGVEVIQAFSATQGCAVVVTNSSSLGKLWIVELCRDSYGFPALTRARVIDSSSIPLTGSKSAAIGNAMVVLDTLSAGERVLALGVPLDGATKTSREGRVVIVAVNPNTLAVSRVARLPEVYGSTDPVGAQLTAGAMFGSSVASLRGFAGGKGIAVLVPGDAALPLVGRIQLIRLDASYHKLSSVSILGTPTTPDYTVTGAAASISAADYDFDGVSDLLVGLPKAKATGGVLVPGGFAITLLNANGTVKGTQFIQPGLAGFSGATLPNAMAFGNRVLATDLNRDGRMDAIVGQKGAATIPGAIWNLQLK